MRIAISLEGSPPVCSLLSKSGVYRDGEFSVLRLCVRMKEETSLPNRPSVPHPLCTQRPRDPAYDTFTCQSQVGPPFLIAPAELEACPHRDPPTGSVHESPSRGMLWGDCGHVCAEQCQDFPRSVADLPQEDPWCLHGEEYTAPKRVTALC